MAADADLNTRMLATLRCPTCRTALRDSANPGDDVTRLECPGCGARWPVRFGIPDLRPVGTEDPYLSRDDDLRAAERLFERARTGGFPDALAAYYETNEKVSAAQARRFIAGTMAAEARARAVLATWRAWCDFEEQRTVVDVGCGTGPLLVCAGAHRLPFADDSVDVVASESLLENAMPARGVMEEAARVLRPGGWLCLTTANRWSVGPDPHVGLPLGGWLSEGLVRAWATRRGMVPPRRRLLSAGELKRLLPAPAFDQQQIGPAPVTDAQRQGASPVMRAAIDAYRVVSGTAIGRAALVAIGPSLLAVARKARRPRESEPAPRP